MKKLNLFNRLFTDSHEKQTPQRAIRYAAMLIMLLTLGVGQMWAGETKYNWSKDATVFFDNSSTQWSQPYLRLGCGSDDGDWSVNYALTKVAGTKDFWYYTMPAQFNNYAAFQLVNNTGDGYNIYWAGSDHAWTKSTEYQKYAVSSNITLCATDGGTTYCSTTKTNGRKSFTVSYSTSGTGSGTLSVTKYNGSTYDAFSSGSSVDPTQIMKIVATPNSGNALTSFSVSGATRIGETDTYYVTANTTISATFTPEETHDVTVYYKCGAMTIKNSTTESGVGVTTTRSVSAPAINDHTFSSWTAGTGVKTNSSTSSSPISINSKGSGTYSLTANYTLVPCSLYIHTSSGTFATQEEKYLMSYDPDVDAYYYEITTTSSPYYFRFYHNNATQYSAAWANDHYPDIQEATANGSKIICDQNVNVWGNKSSVKFTGLSGSTIKIWFDYQNKQTWITETTYSVAVTSENAARGTVNAASVMAGKNTAASINATPVTNSGWMFKQWSVTSPASLVSDATTASNSVKATGGSGAVQAQFKHRYILRGSIDADGDPAGGMAGWSATDNSAYASATISDGVMTITANLTKAKTRYKFRIKDLTDATVGNGQTGTGDIPNNTAWTLNGSNDVKLTTTAAGTYTFTYTVSTNSFKVVFPTSYTITYEVVGGTGGTMTATVSGETVGASPGKAEAGSTVRFSASPSSGYEFTKWVDGSGSQLSTSNPYDVSSLAADKTVKAVFTAITYDNGVLKKNGGSADGSYTVTYMASTITPTAPTKTGYHVDGYYKEEGTSTLIATSAGALQNDKSGYTDATGHWNYAGVKDLYAKWAANTYTADNNLDKNGGDSHGKYTATYDATSIAINTTPAKEGYHVEGYYDDEDYTTKVATDAGALQPNTSYTDASNKWNYDDDDAVLYTKWTANTWYVRFYKNDGSATGTMSDQSFTYDAASKALTACAFEKTGWDFVGWATTPSGTAIYDDEATVRNLTADEDGIVNLYAKWERHVYTINLDNDYSEGKGSPGTHLDDVDPLTFKVTYGTNSFDYVMSEAPSHWPYTFMGYWTAVGGGGSQILDADGQLVASSVYTDGSGNWKEPNNVTVHAKWQVNQMLSKNVVLHATNGAITLTYNSSAVSGYTESTRTGYLLDGYFTEASDGDMVITNEGEIVDEDDVDGYVDDGKWIYEGASAPYIYAQWTPITYTIQFAKNTDASYVGEETGDDPSEITGVTYDGEVTLPDCPYTRTGYTFIGWAKADKKAKGSVNASLIVDYQYAKGTHNYNISATQDSVAVLYPKWLGNIYTVSFNARGGSSVYPASIDVSFGETYGSGNYGSLPTPTAPTGKAFVGWYTSAVGGTLVEAETQLTTIGAHTLYAHYEDKAIVYFKNTIGWENVFVTYSAYWDTYNNPSKGTGNSGLTYHKMSLVPGTTDIYQDEIPSAILANWTAGDNSKIAFNSKELLTDEDKHAPTTGDYANYNKGEVVYRMDFDSRATMFVPKDDNTNNTDGNYKLNGDAQYISTGYKDGTSSDPEYTSGYWLKYGDTYSGYLFSYQKNGEGDFSAEYKMNASKKGDTVFVYSVKMDANTRYDLRFRKDCQTTNTKSRQFRYGTQITSAACTNLKLVCDPNNNSWMQTTAAGEYKFILTCKKDGHMYLTVEYPLAVNDYRVLYSWNDGSAKEYASEAIKANPDTIDSISVFVHKLEDPVVSRSMKIQKCTGIAAGVVTWTDVTGGGITLSGEDITKNGVYNFAITQPETGDPTGAFAGKYEGDYYIRTECADGGWDQYKDREDNVMTYSAYSKTQTLSDPYSHYHCHYVGSTSTDITFAVATKYSPNISGTMTGDATIGNAATTLPANANVRFSWNEETNAMQRAYIKDAQGPSNARFMVMHGKTSDMIFNPDSSAITAAGSLTADELQFDDMGDWIYQVMLTAKPGAQVSIIANYNDADRYLVGGSSSYETILGGEGSKKYTIMAIYDFKTNRLMNAWTPDGTISEALSNIDMLWIRYRQNAAQQITFSGSGALTNVKVVGAIELRYNDLVGRVASWTYETRPLLRYFISFPFDVNVSDIFGLHGAELGRDFVIRKYDGAERAKKGLFLGDGDTYWVDLTTDSVLHANEGYSLVFDNEYLNGDLGTIWTNKTGGSSVYLYFPAASKVDEISDENETTTLKQHLCQSSRTYTYGGKSMSHSNSDSHWNLIGSPLFHNSYVYSSEGTNGQAGDAAKSTLDSYYAYDAEFNRWYTALYYNKSTSSYYECKAMHAMLVQFAGSVTWSIEAPAAPSSVAARQRQETTNRLVTLNLMQNGEVGDYTYIKMDENGSPDFMLCEDLYKIIYNNKPMLFSYAGENCVSYNKVAVESQTIDLGVEIRKNGTYIFEMPENVQGQVILIDKFAQTRTNLNVDDYEIYLGKGNYYDRFSIEISPNNAPTAIDGVEDGTGTLKDGKAHKFIMNDQMYILLNGVMYDATGKRVQ